MPDFSHDLQFSHMRGCLSRLIMIKLLIWLLKLHLIYQIETVQDRSMFYGFFTKNHRTQFVKNCNFDKGLRNGYQCIVEFTGTQDYALVGDPAGYIGEMHGIPYFKWVYVFIIIWWTPVYDFLNSHRHSIILKMNSWLTINLKSQINFFSFSAIYATNGLLMAQLLCKNHSIVFICARFVHFGMRQKSQCQNETK